MRTTKKSPIEVVQGDGKLKGAKGKFTEKGDKKKCGYSIVEIQRHSKIKPKLGKWWKEEKAAVKSNQKNFCKTYLEKKKKELEEMPSARRIRVLGNAAGGRQQDSCTDNNIYAYLEDADELPNMMEV